MVQFCVVVPWVLWSTLGGRGLGTEREKSEQTVFARTSRSQYRDFFYRICHGSFWDYSAKYDVQVVCLLVL